MASLHRSYPHKIIRPFPVVRNLSKIPIFFEVIRDGVVPIKFTYRFLAKVGFPSSRDRDFLVLMKFLGFIDSKNIPTSRYVELRDKRAFSSVIGSVLITSYADLLDEQGVQDSSYLVEKLVSKFGYSKIHAQNCVNTLEALTQIASPDSDFLGFEKGGESAQEDVSARLGFTDLSESFGKKADIKIKKGTPNLNININIPSNMDPSFYKLLLDGLKDLLR